MATFYGTTSNNTLNGTEASDTFYGYAGTDYLYGYGGNDFLYGGDNTDYLFGLAGNDWIDGGLGADVMRGGINDDVYIVDTGSDQVIEAVNEGLDRVQAAISYTLTANVENLTLTGSAAVNGTGNTLANTMVGNAAANTLLGMDGNDSLSGGGGNDTLTGGTGNDTIDGGIGTDTMRGGLNDDVFVVDTATDSVIENLSEGNDRVNTAITYTLTANVENLNQTGTAAVNATGNTLANTINGNSANNVLSGLAGNDILAASAGADTLNGGDGADQLNGGSGTDTLNGNAGDDSLDGGTEADTLRGGAGNDRYFRDNASDVVTELANEGADLVTTTVTYTLATNLENLTLGGTAGIGGTGNTLGNTIVGNSANNTINGLEGNDVITGGLGVDTLTGGAGADRFVYLTPADSSATVRDAILDFSRGIDKIDLSAIYSAGDLIWNGTVGLANGIWYARGATSTYFLIDTTGDTVHDMSIEVKNSATQLFTPTDFLGVKNSTPPVFTSPSTATVLENDTAVLTVAATDSENNPLNYSIADSPDAPRFKVDAASGVLSFISAPNYEAPADANADNLYSVTVRVSDGFVQATQMLTVTVGNRNELFGTTSADTLIGTGLDEYIAGDAGNDILDGRGGNDILDGGTGNDVIISMDGFDTVRGGAGDDLLQISARAGYEQGAMRVEGNDGNDLFEINPYSGYSYAVEAVGGAGTDTYRLLSSYEANSYVVLDFQAGAGGDKIDVSRIFLSEYNSHPGNNPFASKNLRLFESGGTTYLQYDGDGDYVPDADHRYYFDPVYTLVELRNVSAASITADNFTQAISPDGSPARDQIIQGTSGIDNLTDGFGHDTVYGLSGSDLVQATLGDDTIYGGDETGTGDNLSGGAGNDTIYGSAGDDTLAGNGGANYLDGGIGNDTLHWQGSGDTLMGGAGNDILKIGGPGTVLASGNEGADQFDLLDFGFGTAFLTGGAGVDTYTPISSYSAGTSTVDDFTIGEGGDKIDLNRLLDQSDGADGRALYDGGNPFGLDVALFSLVQQGTDTVVRYDRNGTVWSDSLQDLIVLKNVSASSLTRDNFVGLIAPDGSEPAMGNTVNGTAAADHLTGSLGGDMLSGLGGADRIEGFAGNDTLRGGDETGVGDTIYGGAGDDSIFGDGGDDTLFSGRGTDMLYGGTGADILHADYRGTATLAGGGGSDRFVFHDLADNPSNARPIAATLTDFTVGSTSVQGDVLDLRDLSLSDVFVNQEGQDTTIIAYMAWFDSSYIVARLVGVQTTEADLLSNGNLIM